MTERKTGDQYDRASIPVPPAPSDEISSAKVKAEQVVLERRQRAVHSCQIAVLALEEGIRTLLKDAMDQVKKITGQPNIMLFAMLPQPHSKDFATMMPSTGGVELAKARWKYEILYTTAAPLEEVYGGLIEMETRMEWKDPPGAKPGKKKKKNIESKRVSNLLSSLEAVVTILDRLSEKVGKDRFEVEEKVLARWDKATQKGRDAMVAEAWGAAKAAWAGKGYQKLEQANQLRMLRVLKRYRVLKPILKSWGQLLEAAAEVKECFSK